MDCSVGSTLVVIAVRTGTTGAVWASYRAKPHTSTSTCARSASLLRTPWQFWRHSQIKTMRGWRESCAPYRFVFRQQFAAATKNGVLLNWGFTISSYMDTILYQPYYVERLISFKHCYVNLLLQVCTNLFRLSIRLLKKWPLLTIILWKWCHHAHITFLETEFILE